MSMHMPVLKVPDIEIVVFQWSRKHGECEDCGLPAAFLSERYTRDAIGGPAGRLCAVCAANDAANGMTIRRIEEIE